MSAFISENPTPAAPLSIRGACPHDCPDTCGLVTTVENGVATRVQGNPDHPHTDGVLCAKVSKYTERTYHPERILTPLKRSGAKGSGQFTPVTWDEALSDIAQRLQAIATRAPEAILPYSYAGTMGLLQGESMDRRFFHRLGASLLDRTICASAGGEALTATYGGKIGMHLAHYADSKLILIWGSNSIASNLHFWTFAQAAKRAGAKLVCIDPRRSETADIADIHLAVRPGGDAFLLAAMIATVVQEGLVAEAWLQQGRIGRILAIQSSFGFRCDYDPQHRNFNPALAGGTLLLLTDTIARTIVAPQQLPVGVITALLGVPTFIALLLGRGGRR